MLLWSSIRRMAHIIRVLLAHGLAHALGARATLWPAMARRLPAVGVTGPERLRALIEDMGGTFIKFGQMLALQPDILPIEYCNALFNLLDHVSPFPVEEVDRVFREELGRTPGELFAEFDSEPIATASIGQVHVAYLDGRKWAVKVQRPSVDTDFAGDIKIMAACIRLIRSLRVKPLYWLIEPMSEFVAWTGEELDYRREARYLEQQRRNSSRNPKESVPEVFSQFTTRRTLVAEFIEGISVLNFLRAMDARDQVTIARLRAMSFDPVQFVRNLLDNFLGDAYRYGMFHADLHPANLLILPGNVVGYIDFGITGVLSRYSRRHLVELTLNLSRGDLDGMCETFFRVSTCDDTSDTAAFREGLERLAQEWYEQRGDERRLVKNTTLVMMDMLKLSRRTNIYPARDVVKYIRSAIAIDGLITRVAPGFDLARHLELISNHYLKWDSRQTLFSYDSIVGWSAASSRLIKDGPLRAAGLVRLVSEGKLPAKVEIRGGRRDIEEGLRLKALLLGAMMLVVALVMTVSSKPSLGVNLFTAEAAVITAAAAVLWQTLRRLA